MSVWVTLYSTLGSQLTFENFYLETLHQHQICETIVTWFFTCQKFATIISWVILHGQLHGELTFENFYLVPCRFGMVFQLDACMCDDVCVRMYVWGCMCEMYLMSRVHVCDMTHTCVTWPIDMAHWSRYVWGCMCKASLLRLMYVCVTWLIHTWCD